jgi:hypothetical protein
MFVDNLTLAGFSTVLFIIGIYLGMCLTNPRCDRRYAKLLERIGDNTVGVLNRLRCSVCRWTKDRLSPLCPCNKPEIRLT